MPRVWLCCWLNTLEFSLLYISLNENFYSHSHLRHSTSRLIKSTEALHLQSTTLLNICRCCPNDNFSISDRKIEINVYVSDGHNQHNIPHTSSPHWSNTVEIVIWMTCNGPRHRHYQNQLQRPVAASGLSILTFTPTFSETIYAE